MTQVQVELDAAVGVTEETQVGHSDLGSGFCLLVATNGRHACALDLLVVAARFTIRHEAIGHHHAGIGEVGHRARRPEIDIVWVGRDHQGTFDLVRFEHVAQARSFYAALMANAFVFESSEP